jgi:hypothetical protein
MSSKSATSVSGVDLDLIEGARVEHGQRRVCRRERRGLRSVWPGGQTSVVVSSLPETMTLWVIESSCPLKRPVTCAQPRETTKVWDCAGGPPASPQL